MAARSIPVRTRTNLTMRDLQVSDLDEAVRVVSYSMRDNPMNVHAFGIEDVGQRALSLVRFFKPVLRGLHKRGAIMGAFHDNALVGVCGMAPPGSCQPTLLETVNVLPSLVFGRPVGAVMRVLRWTGKWARRDPTRPHWHLGPVAVDPDLQGQGIGGAMLSAFCERMDQEHALSYLETDKLENVGFYQKFGFRVIEQAPVLGIPNWFMSRPPRTTQRVARVLLRDSIRVCSKNLKDDAARPQYPQPASFSRRYNGF